VVYSSHDLQDKKVQCRKGDDDIYDCSIKHTVHFCFSIKAPQTMHHDENDYTNGDFPLLTDSVLFNSIERGDSCETGI